MATRTLEIDLRQGTGASSEPMYGVVTVQRAKAKSAGGFEILPFETSLKLINGKATITEAETDGTGPFYDSVYLFRVQNGYCAPRWGFMAALPDGSTPITTGELPMVDPITGEGIYMDAQEWNALYGDLPDRVTSLETGKANTSHTHAIGDVTGLQPALNAKGNATMRVDTSAGLAIYITDGTVERLVKYDSGWRDISGSFANGWTGRLLARREDGVVELRFSQLDGTNATAASFITSLPQLFRTGQGVLTALALTGDAASGITQATFISTSGSQNQLWRGVRGLYEGAGIANVVYTTDFPLQPALPGTPA